MIIDGRIADIIKSGFIEGTIVIPSFVLEELRHIADSSDLLKRNRGRRGLDILNKIRKEMAVHVKVLEIDYDDLAEVDSKLVRLAQKRPPILTNDYNLNKVAELQGVRVLNINELANAVKPVVLPGEEMTVQVIKDGKEIGQGSGLPGRRHDDCCGKRAPLYRPDHRRSSHQRPADSSRPDDLRPAQGVGATQNRRQPPGPGAGRVPVLS